MGSLEQETLDPEIHRTSKKWKEYFLEFLMIFLAVTLGFLADNLRESLADATKEKQYIEGLIRNLTDDVVSLHHVIESDRQQVLGLDSMLMLSHVNLAIDSNRKSFYYFVIKYCYNSTTFSSNDATLQQLKSTGDYGLIEKDHVADSLTRYDSNMRSTYKQGEYYEAYFKDILSRLDELVDMTVLEDTSFIKSGKVKDKPFPQLRAEDGKLATFFNKVLIFKIITHAYVENNLNPQLESSKRLIEFLKNKYDVHSQ